MKLCDYGCGKEATHQFKNGKWCCFDNANKCPKKREHISIISKNPSQETRKKMSESHIGKIPWNKGKTGIYSNETKNKIRKARHLQKPPRKGIKHTKETKKKIALKNKGRRTTLTYYRKKYPLLIKIEELKEDKNKNILGHCKNHNCENSKEKNGWFILSTLQLLHRILVIYSPNGFGESNFYCSNECKYECPLYRLRTDPHQNNEIPYTQEEYKQFRQFVLKRDNYECQYCGEKAEHVHHEKPQKLEPFFSLDPDFAWSCCEKCHYKYGHNGDCSTGKLANKSCKN